MAMTMVLMMMMVTVMAMMVAMVVIVVMLMVVMVVMVVMVMVVMAVMVMIVAMEVTVVVVMVVMVVMSCPVPTCPPTLTIIRSNFGPKTFSGPHHSAMADWGRGGWDAWRNWRRGWAAGSGDWSAGSGWWHGRRPSSQVAGSAASRSVQPRDMQWWSQDVPLGLRYFDNQNIQDMQEGEQQEAKTPSRRVEKLGKAFQNYRRAIRRRLCDMVKKKVYFLAWR